MKDLQTNALTGRKIMTLSILKDERYSSLSNKRAARSYYFLEIFQPAWPYYILHVY